jgi:hypothetical protein
MSRLEKAKPAIAKVSMVVAVFGGTKCSLPHCLKARPPIPKGLNHSAQRLADSERPTLGIVIHFPQP